MSKKIEEKEVAVSAATEVVVSAEELAEWGMEEQEVSSKDLIIPRLWCMQALSELVAEKEVCKVGDIVCSMTEKVLGDTTKPVSVIPFKVEKLMYIVKQNGDKGELTDIIPTTKDNENLPLEFEADGERYKRQFVYKYFVLVEGQELPYTIIFKGMSLRAGKQLFTEMFIKNKMAGKSPAAYKMNIMSEKMKNEKGTFYILKVGRGEAAPMAEQKRALDWFKSLKVTEFVEAGDESEKTSDNNAKF